MPTEKLRKMGQGYKKVASETVMVIFQMNSRWGFNLLFRQTISYNVMHTALNQPRTCPRALIDRSCNIATSQQWSSYTVASIVTKILKTGEPQYT